MSKKISKSKFQEWKGLDRIQLVVHEELNCVYREISKDDFGIDGEIQIVRSRDNEEGYEVTGGVLKFQAKSGSSYIVQDREDSFNCKVRKVDLEHWYNSNFETLFIIYHPDDDQLYWKHINNYIKESKNIWQEPHKVRFNKSDDKFNSSVYDKLFKIGEVSPPRVDFNTKEKLISNLLIVKKLPEVWSAPTNLDNRKDLYKNIDGYTPPFRLYKNKLYSFSYLAREGSKLGQFCDISEMKHEDKEVLWEDEDTKRLYVSMLNKLLGSHLHRRGIYYSKDFHRNYFALPNKDQKTFKKSWYNIRTRREVQPRIIVKHYEYGIDKFWRHTALEYRFIQIAGDWFLQLMPTFFLTSDGEIPYQSDRVGRLVTKVQAFNYNPGALNDVLFWSDVLADAQSNEGRKRNIEVQLNFEPILVLKRMPVNGETDFAPFTDSSPIREMNDKNQLSLLDE